MGGSLDDLGPETVVTRLVLALVCGALLGLDREARGKPAGLRTNTLVALSAAATTLVALEMLAESTARGQPGDVDPTRVIQGLAQAIGFIAAGVMIQSGGTVRGATTAAMVWMAGALGIACGAGYHVIAFIALGLSLMVMLVLSPLERWLFKGERKRTGPEDPDEEDAP
ncbi:MgtC/SapB family protein [Azospirillum sp. RWY-5-1]|uniref:Protein MgtC n=1 Tax=Azospirillum oleiclasticum TaxID=2735135 RepID=A0ABX2TAF9_9PROT|nr:MgtC/SapB family protein [Azospirillum oleiclasticum]NYZ15247.1 MgtC/SapB family protein [Azospirillum oleiclasticum]NYZ21332.1 MgtC/SapB family protein [Azospirillum oleiclasticum]